MRTILSLIIISIAINTHAAGLDDLTPVTQWQNPAPGIWKTTFGDMSGELRYTEFAAAPPQLKALNAIPPTPFPFNSEKISYLITPDHKIMVRIPADNDEKLYGFGLQFDSIKKSKKVLTLNVDHWSKGGGKTHAPVPFYISSKGYGVFFNTARFLKTYVQIGSRKDSTNNPPPVDRNPPADEPQPTRWSSAPISDAVEAQINADGLEIIVFSGKTLLDVVSRYNLYCGGGALPPLWGLGFSHRVHAKFNADQTNQEVQQFKERNFPLDVIGLEPGWQSKSYPCTYEWQKKRFPDPAAFAQNLLDKGVRLNLWINPYISPHSRIYKQMYPLSGSHLVWLGIVPDYTLPQARKILTDQFNQDHISIGISGYKIDEVDGYDHWLWPDHATFPSGTSGESLRQSYGLIMQRMLYNDLFKKYNTRTYSLVRASNGAASGYPFAIYSDSYNHSEYITGISAASLSGILWTPEVRSASNSREWLNRMQTVCFSPMAKLNAWSSGKKPWEFPEVTDAVRDVINLRMQLLPYLYTAFANYQQKGIPPMRAMILEDGFDFQEKYTEGKLDSEKNPYAEGKIIEVTDQFMFGPSIMVAPFYESNATQREVQFPAGDWHDFYTGALVSQQKTITVTAKQLKNRTPLFVKAGAIIPMLTKTVSNAQEAYNHPLKLQVYGHTQGSFDLYEDDGKTFNYEKGQFRIRTITVKQNNSGTITPQQNITLNNAPPLFGPIQSATLMSP